MKYEMICGLLANAASHAAAETDSLWRYRRTRKVLVKDKGRGDIVTEVDTQLQRHWLEFVRPQLPEGVMLLCEEDEASHKNIGKRFIVLDPLDGTKIFESGVKDWCIQSALIEFGKVVAAAIFFPEKGEMYRATLGGGASLNGIPCLSCDETRDHGLVYAAPESDKCDPSVLEPLVAPLRTKKILGTPRELGGAGANGCEVAQGHVKMYIAATGANIYDLAPPALIVSEAGGCVFTPEGTDVVWDKFSQPIIYTSGPRVKELLLSTWAESRI